MTTLNFIKIFLITSLYSCGQNSANFKVDPAAVELNNKAMTLFEFIDNGDSARKAISFLDHATTIDSNYFLGHCNKLIFLNQLKQFGNAISTINKLIQLRPSAQDLYLTGGILYERIGDTISSKSYFEKSLTICFSVLDTMSNKDRDYEMLVTNKAINLIMLGQQERANKILQALYDTLPDDPEYENVTKKGIHSLMNKNKAELMETFINPEKYSH